MTTVSPGFGSQIFKNPNKAVLLKYNFKTFLQYDFFIAMIYNYYQILVSYDITAYLHRSEL